MEKTDIIVIGAGAAGLMAAGRAAEKGARVLLLEHQEKPGRKLAITGKGRCNLTNSIDLPEFLKHFQPNGRFLRQAFSAFFSKQTIDFFNQQGVPTVVERGGRVFPSSGKAMDVVNALVSWNEKNGVVIQKRTSAEELLLENNVIKGLKICPTSSHKGKIIKNKTMSLIIKADKVIIATGGISYPATGSTGDGYRLAESVGHSIVPVRPALVALETSDKRSEKIQDTALKNVNVIAWVNGKKQAEAFGEMTFMSFGLSGPVILTLSGGIVDALNEGGKVFITIDLKPALDPKKLDARLLRELGQHGKKQFQTIMKELLPKNMIDFCLDELKISPLKPCNQISAEERKNLRVWLKELRFEITGYRPFSEAIITAGGVRVQEINPKTMESRKVKNLFFAGEVLDIQADTGGYNLQAAFSTGWLAAESAVNTP
ncbi:NAD(P)/FAD-dependent oxidoreductase [bacterium]|nr:NAD(P)/FAD-dependent oxidoreductase [bacterium]